MTGGIQADPILSALSWYGPQESPSALLNIFLAKPPGLVFCVEDMAEV
jgi:hypothetical protein